MIAVATVVTRITDYKATSSRPLKSHNFAVTLAVFSSVSRSHNKTQKSDNKQSHKQKGYNFLL